MLDVICGVKKNLILPEEFVFRIRKLQCSAPSTLEILDALEVIRDKFRRGELTRQEWYRISGMRRTGSWRNWKRAIKPNVVLAQNYLDFGNKKQKHKLDGYQRFLLYFVEVLLIVNRNYDTARIFLSSENNYQQITRRKFVVWVDK